MSQSTAVALHTDRTPTEAPTGISAIIDQARTSIAPFLPRGVTFERVMGEVALAARENPALTECVPETIITSVIRALRLDLEIGVEFYLVPFRESVKVNGQWQKRMVCTGIAGYKGLAGLAQRCGAARSVEARCVYAGETFEIEHGLNPILRHVPSAEAKERGRIVGAYYIIGMPRNAAPLFGFVPIADIEAVRAKSKQWGPDKVPECPPWWAEKRAVLVGLKLVPKNGRLAERLQLIEQDEVGTFEPMPDAPRLASGGEPELTYRTLGPVSPAGYEADDEIPDPSRFKAGYEPPTRAGNTTAQLTPAAMEEAAKADPYDVAHQVTGEIDASAWAEVDEDTTPMSKRLTVNDLARKARERKAQRDWLHTQVITKGALTLSQAQYVQKTLLDESLREADLSELVAQIKAKQAQAAATASGEVVCEKCGGKVFDNRGTKTNPKAPNLKCRDGACGWIQWPSKEEVAADEARLAGDDDEGAR